MLRGSFLSDPWHLVKVDPTRGNHGGIIPTVVNTLVMVPIFPGSEGLKNLAHPCQVESTLLPLNSGHDASNIPSTHNLLPRDSTRRVARTHVLFKRSPSKTQCLLSRDMTVDMREPFRFSSQNPWF